MDSKTYKSCKRYKCCSMIINQRATATVTQAQEVTQTNNNQQMTVYANAEDGGTASARQVSRQANNNAQAGASVARNTVGECCCDSNINQTAEASVEQQQYVDQSNVNEQNEVTAVAVGEGSEASAEQQNFQTNTNSQTGIAEAENSLDDDCERQSAASSKVDAVKKDAGSNQKKNESSHIVNNEAIIAFNGIRLVVTIGEDRQTLLIQADKNGELVVNETKQIASRVKDVKTQNTPTGNKIVITTERDKDPVEVELNKDGEIFINGDKIAAV